MFVFEAAMNTEFQDIKDVENSVRLLYHDSCPLTWPEDQHQHIMVTVTVTITVTITVTGYLFAYCDPATVTAITALNLPQGLLSLK
jgi:hypothetical protein